MRLDVYLKKTRLVPRRTGASELCREGKVEVNGHPAKPARPVRTGDRLRFRLPARELFVEILDLPVSKGISKAEARTYYRLLDEKWFDLWGREIHRD